MDFLNENMHNIIVAAVILLILVVLLAVWRRFSPRVAGGRRGQRLGISEYYEVDKDRRLVLVRRDNVEHLILIGGPQDVVIEAGISSASVAEAYTPAPINSARTEAAAPVFRPAPRAPTFGEKKPPPLRPVEAAAPAARREEPEL